MKKVFKIAGKIIGGYAIFNTLCWAWVGTGRCIEHVDANSEKSVGGIIEDIIDETAASWKKFFGWCKALAD